MVYFSHVRYFFLLCKETYFFGITLFLENTKIRKPLKNIFEFTLQHRKNLHQILTNTPKQQLLHVPEGFRNNIWWNIAHVVVTQQILAYGLSGLDMRVPDTLVAAYKKGTEPPETVSDADMALVEKLLVDTIEWTQADYARGLFTNFNAYTTSAKITLTNIEDALSFNLFHEGLHLGSVLALRKLVGSTG